LPLGVLWARALRKADRAIRGKPIWFAGHRVLQTCGVLLQFLGFVSIIIHKQAGSSMLVPHFTTPHEVIGLLVVIFGCWQPLQAMSRNLSCIGHPRADGTRTRARAIWEYMHKGVGYAAATLGLLNVVLGIVYASSLGFGDGLIPVAAALFASLSVGAFACLVLVWMRTLAQSEVKAVVSRGE